MTQYGTGKTLLMEAKAKWLLNDKQKVVMIVFHDKSISLVTVKLKNQFKGDKNVHIQGLSGKGKMIF